MKIILIADTCVDRFIYGDATRKNPEAPSLVFKPERTEETGGMGLNVYNNLISLGIKHYNIVVFFPRQKTIKERYVDSESNYILFRADHNDECLVPFGEPELFRLNQFLQKDPNSMIIISDYGKGYINEYYFEKIANLGKEYGIKVLADTKKILNSFSRNVTFIKINELEYSENIKRGIKPEDWAENIIKTRGKLGSEWVNKGLTFPTEPVQIGDVVGAGDSYLSGLAVGVYEGMKIEDAIRFANRVAGIAVSKKGVVSVNRADLT